MFIDRVGVGVKKYTKTSRPFLASKFAARYEGHAMV